MPPPSVRVDASGLGVAGAAQAQVFLRDAETVLRFAHDGEPAHVRDQIVVAERHAALAQHDLLVADRAALADDGWVYAAALLAQIDHSALPRVFDSGVVEGRAYIVVEYLEGETLAERLSREPLSEAATRQLAAELCRAMADRNRIPDALTDYRDVLGEIVSRRFPDRSVAQLFPDISYSPLNFMVTLHTAMMGTAPNFAEQFDANGRKPPGRLRVPGASAGGRGATRSQADRSDGAIRRTMPSRRRIVRTS